MCNCYNRCIKQRHINSLFSFLFSRRESPDVVLIPSKDQPNQTDTLVTKQQKWTLVDIPRHYNTNNSGVIPHKKLHHILWFNMPPWMSSFDYGFMSLCDYKNCKVTQDRGMIKSVSAVLFCVIQPGMGYFPPLNQTERDPDQVWVFYGLEAPFNYHFDEYMSKHWRNTFNWSLTYRTDSDVQEPYGQLRTIDNPIKRDYDKIFEEKTKFAVWIVSHCLTHSKREKFVHEMQRYVSVDIYGLCGQLFSSDIETLVKEYKFFLSFENSLCPDYVTEKFFKYFGLSIIQVVRGGVDYDSLLPNETFINTAKFPDVKTLTQYLSDVGSDKEQYVNYLRRKDAYVAENEDFTYNNAMCDLCRRLNHKQTYRKSYEDIHDYIQNTKVCIQPDEIRDVQPDIMQKHRYWTKLKI